MFLLNLNSIENVETQKRLESIYITHKETMFFVAFSILKSKEDAEDAVHNAFLNIAMNMNKIATLDDKELKSYLLKSVKNSAINTYKYKKKRNLMELEWLENINYSKTLNDKLQTSVTPTEFERVTKCIDKLPEIYRSVLKIHFQEKKTICQTAKIMGISISATKQRLVRGKKMIICMLKDR